MNLRQERNLARKARLGDETSRKQLILSNLKFVAAFARKYLRSGLSLPDLINAGNYGLIQAAYRYDERKKVRFLTYAVWWIRKAIYDAIYEERGLISGFKLDRNLDRIINRLYARLGRAPDINDIARELNIPPEEVTLAGPKYISYISLDQPVEEEKTPWSELIDALTIPSPEEIYHQKELKKTIKKHLDILDKIEKMVIERSFGLGDQPIESIDRISKSLNMTREKVRMIREQALRKLRLVLFREWLEA